MFSATKRRKIVFGTPCLPRERWYRDWLCMDPIIADYTRSPPHGRLRAVGYVLAIAHAYAVGIEH
jgi:hypothetical protein